MEIFDLSNIPAYSYSAVGGKARGLHALSMAGLKIAQGFVITDSGMKRILIRRPITMWKAVWYW